MRRTTSDVISSPTRPVCNRTVEAKEESHGQSPCTYPSTPRSPMHSARSDAEAPLMIEEQSVTGTPEAQLVSEQERTGVDSCA